MCLGLNETCASLLTLHVISSTTEATREARGNYFNKRYQLIHSSYRNCSLNRILADTRDIICLASYTQVNNVFQFQKNIENVWSKTTLKRWSNLISLTWCNLRENLSFTEKNNSLGNIRTGRHSNRNSQCGDGGPREWYQVKDKQNVYERILFSSVLINGHGLFEVRNSFVCWFWLLR